MDGTKLSLTCSQGTHLLRLSHGAQLPKQLGELAIGEAERALAGQDILRLYRELRDYSPLCKFDRKLCFGDKENWISVDEKSGAFRIVDPDRATEVRLSEEAVQGAYWCLLLLAHPESPGAGIPALMDEVTWPVAEKLKLTRQLAKDTGLDKKKSRRIAFDDSPEWKDETAKA